MFVVRRVEVDYLSPARFNDALEVSVSLKRIGGASLVVEQTVARGVTPLIAGARDAGVRRCGAIQTR